MPRQMSPGGLCNLKRLGVLVTRPEHQAEPLCDLIEASNGRPLRFPGVRILPAEDQAGVAKRLSTLERFDTLIFVSPNAVSHALTHLGDRVLPESVEIAAVGRGTADCLARSGYPVSIVPAERFDSEALLETTELKQVENKSILILRGVGGRPLLGETLRSRGARVEFAELYRRLPPEADPTELLSRWVADVGVITITSQEILDNLWTLLGDKGRRYMKETPVLVVSERIRDYARTLGLRKIITAARAENRVMVEALCAWVSD